VQAAATDHARTHRIVSGLMPAVFLAAIDGSMVPVALLTIGAALGDPSLIAWVMAGYLVAGAVATPVYGKLSDLHGRRRMMTAALSIALVGSMLCAVATSMPMLVAARVLQGLGSGVVFALAQAAMADVVSGPERGRYQGWFSAVFASAALAAPVAGGVLTEYLSWRAIFVLNAPLVLFALWSVRRVLPPQERARGEARIDWWGAALLTAGIAVTLVALTRIGQGVGWLDRSTLSLAALGVVLTAVWAWREADAPEPIVPLSLFANRTLLNCCMATALNFFVLIGCTVLLPLSMQAVGGARAGEVAVRLVALTLSVPAGALVVGRLMMMTPQVGRLSAAGCFLAALALAGLAVVSPRAAAAQTALMLPLGFGLGMALPGMMVAGQAAVGPSMIGVATSLISFSRSLGGVIGTAMLTSLVLAGAGGGAITDADPDTLARAFSKAFAVASAMAAAAAVFSLRLGPVRSVVPAASAGARS
jgi:MFS family permease